MTTERDAAYRVLTAKRALADAKAELDAAIADLRGILGVGDRKRLAGVGEVRIDRGATTTKVVDDTAILGWFKANQPENVETVEQVRPAVLAKLRKDHGIIASTGEEVPGLVTDEGDPKVVVTLARQDEDEPAVEQVADVVDFTSRRAAQ